MKPAGLAEAISVSACLAVRHESAAGVRGRPYVMLKINEKYVLLNLIQSFEGSGAYVTTLSFITRSFQMSKTDEICLDTTFLPSILIELWPDEILTMINIIHFIRA